MKKIETTEQTCPVCGTVAELRAEADKVRVLNNSGCVHLHVDGQNWGWIKSDARRAQSNGRKSGHKEGGR